MFETMLGWYAQHELQQRIKEIIDSDHGWHVMYVIPTPIPQTNFNSSSSNGYVTVDANGGATIFIPGRSQSMGSPQYEVCFYRKDWAKEPCPRCNHPYPNEDAIGRDG